MSLNEIKEKIYIPIHTANSNQVLSGLGKSTKRGIKKCNKCGTYNGTRSAMCKNKNCGVILKDSEEKSRVDLDAVKLFTGTEKQVYSVRVRDMGPDYRGFVQLPILQSQEDKNILSKVALCFVDSCQNSFDNSILKCHDEDQHGNNQVCAHIESALKSQSNATPMEFKGEVLQSFQVTEEIKEKLFILANEKQGCLVQQVSKSIMAVKCQATPKHPLGYLHFGFIKGRGRECYEKYFCSCIDFLDSRYMQEKEVNKCIHYYACIWALASNSKYFEEFSYFLQNDLPISAGILNLDVKQNEPHETPKYHQQTTEMKVITRKCLKVKHRKLRVSKQSCKRELIKRCQRIIPKIYPIEIKVLNETPKDEHVACWTFIDWLSYVTESINKTMQFDNCGIVNTLVFQIPQTFYNYFMKRIPNTYQVTETEAICHYSIMNILHLKQIFDTPLVKLRISKKFVHTEQKGYVEYNETEHNSEIYQCSFIFFLNVGQSTVDESDNTNNSFEIEWIPKVTAVTTVGQLKLQYKYGRKST